MRVALGDITKVVGVEYICNAANGTGPMGAGVAGVIRRAGGKVIEKDAFRVCKLNDPQEGSLYLTVPGSLPFRGIIHLVTMKNPGGETSYDIVRSCLRSLVQFCRASGIGSVALPALGTGVGGLSPMLVAQIYIQELANIVETDFLVVDINEEFINWFK